MKGFQWKKLNNTKLGNTFWVQAKDVELDAVHSEIEKLFCAATTISSIVGQPGIS
jgi:hypothetical protein